MHRASVGLLYLRSPTPRMWPGTVGAGHWGKAKEREGSATLPLLLPVLQWASSSRRPWSPTTIASQSACPLCLGRQLHLYWSLLVSDIHGALGVLAKGTEWAFLEVWNGELRWPLLRYHIRWSLNGSTGPSDLKVMESHGWRWECCSLRSRWDREQERLFCKVWLWRWRCLSEKACEDPEGFTVVVVLFSFIFYVLVFLFSSSSAFFIENGEGRIFQGQ